MNDPLVDEVRRARREISRECGHDIRRLFARYSAMQKRMKAQGKGHFVSQPPVGRRRDMPAVRPT